MATLNDGNFYLSSQLTKNGMLILGSSYGKIVIYDQNNEMDQSITSSTRPIGAASASDDYSLLTGAGYAGEVKAY